MSGVSAAARVAAAAAASQPYNPFNLPPAHLPIERGDAPAGSAASFTAHVAAAREFAASLASFLSTDDAEVVLSTHPVQFLTRSPLSRLPPSWADELRSAEVGTAHEWLQPPPPGAPPPPPGSLAAWFAAARALEMPREPRPALPAPAAGTAAAEALSAAPAVAAAALPKCEKMNTTRKKAHELEAFGDVAAAAAARARCSCVVDAGAGEGRLGGVLCARYGLHVTGLERDASAVARAARRRACVDADAARRASSGAAEQAPQQTQERQQTPPARCVVLRGALDGTASAAEQCGVASPALLVGLHACGDLTTSVLREFARSASPFAALLVAGCCYQHAETFPLSAAVAGALPPAPRAAALPRRVREAAAQSSSAAFLTAQPAAARDTIRAKTLARALLEQLHAEQQQRSDTRRDSGAVKSTTGPATSLEAKWPYDPRLPFAQYATAALGGCGEPAALNARFQHTLAEHAAAVSGFSAMRCAAGAVAEALFVLDRALFLAEAMLAEQKCGQAANDTSAATLSAPAMALLPLFDPGVSPRNLVLWASRAG